jgi:aspartate kinase
VSAEATADLSFTVERGDVEAAVAALEGLDLSTGIQTDDRIGKVSIVGAGMRSHPGVAARVFQTLGQNGINIEMISTSPIKISCVIAADAVPTAVQALHEAFDLGEDAVRREEPTGAEHRPRVAP